MRLRHSTLPPEVVTHLFSTLDSPSFYRGDIKACCPYHDESTPSMFVYEKDEQFRFYCFGCNASGSVRKLIKKLKGHHLLDLVPEDQPHVRRTDKSEIVETYRLDSTRGFAPVSYYFQARGLSEEFCNAWGFKMDLYTPAGVMPVYTRHKYKGYIARSIDPRCKIRYYIEPNMDIARSIWGLDKLDPSRKVFVVEGIIDAASIWMAGGQAVALLGKKWHTKIDLLQNYNLICVPDNGDAKSIETFQELTLQTSGMTAFVPYQYKDVNQFYTSDPDSFEAWVTNFQ